MHLEEKHEGSFVEDIETKAGSLKKESQQDSSAKLQENLEELATLESLDNGKPYSIAKAADVPLVSHLLP